MTGRDDFLQELRDEALARRRAEWCAVHQVELGEGAFVHAKAHVERSKIGARTSVWQFASVIRGATIGDDCNVASGACIDGSTIGNRCVIGHNLAMGPGFLVDDDVFIGPNVTFCNDRWPRAAKEGFDVSAFGPDRHAIVVQRGASIGANSVILPGVWIGHGAMVAAGSIVKDQVPGNMLHLRDGELRLITDEMRHRAERIRLVFDDLQSLQ